MTYIQDYAGFQIFKDSESYFWAVKSGLGVCLGTHPHFEYLG